MNIHLMQYIYPCCARTRYTRGTSRFVILWFFLKMGKRKDQRGPRTATAKESHQSSAIMIRGQFIHPRAQSRTQSTGTWLGASSWKSRAHSVYGERPAVSAVLSTLVYWHFCAVTRDSQNVRVGELVVRKELSDNYCFYNPKYDSLSGAHRCCFYNFCGYCLNLK